MLNDSKNQIKILIAEDNLVNQKVLCIILDLYNYSYDIAQDGVEVVKMYENGNYNLILMDCQMPNRDGLQATTCIRELEQSKKTNRCPIVAMTANAMQGDRERCLAVGMDDFIAKPFKKNELLELIKIWSHQEKPVEVS